MSTAQDVTDARTPVGPASSVGDAPPRAGLREWAGLAVLALPCLLVSMDANVLNLAIPELASHLRPTTAELLWIVDAYGFLVAGLLVTMGALGDRIGRRRLLLVGAAGFGAASVLAALATTPAMLIAARALLGIAGATLMPSTLSLIRVMFIDPRQRRTAFGVWTACFALGGVLAPLVAGVLLQHFHWGSVFLVAVPVTAALLVLGPTLLPESRAPAAARLDLASAALSLAAVLSTVLGLKRAAQDGLDPKAAAAIALGAVLAGLVARRQQRARDPWIDLGLVRRRSFAIPLAANALGFLVLYGTAFFVVQYLQLVLGFSPLRAGLWTIPSALGFLAGSALAPVVAGRLRPGWVLGGGLLVAAAGFALLTQAGPGGGLMLVVAASVVFSVGLAPVYVLATELTVAAVPPERAGAASGILEASAELGGALGIAVLGSVGGALYRSGMEASGQAGVPEHLWEQATRTLGGALAAASRLQEPAAAGLSGTAREAFVQAFQAVGAIGAGALAGLAVACGLLLRAVPCGAGRDGDG